MSKKGFKKKIFVSIFSFYFIAFQFFLVPQANAFDWFNAGWAPIQKIIGSIEGVVEGTTKTAISTGISYFLQTMAKDVASGIVSGSTGGEPLFKVETFTTSLSKAADNATGIFLDDLSERGFDTLGLCQPISFQSATLEGDITGALAEALSSITDTLNLVPDFGEYDLTNRTPTCTISKVIETFQDNIDYTINAYFSYLFLDYFKDNCNTSEFENFENDFSNTITSFMGFSLSNLNPSSILPSAEELSGALESLASGYDLDCKFFVKGTGDGMYDSGSDEITSDINGDIDWFATADKLLQEVMFPIIINSLQMVFGDYNVVIEDPGEILKSQVRQACYKMAESIDDDVLLSMINPNDFVENIHHYESSIAFSSRQVSIDLFNQVVKYMDPYYYYPSVDYLEHFKKCVHVSSVLGESPYFITDDPDTKEKEEECWLKIYEDGDDIKYKGVVPFKNTSENYKKDIKESLVSYCIIISEQRIPFFPQVARKEANKGLDKLAKYNEKIRLEAETAEATDFVTADIKATRDQISQNVTTTSTQNTEMAKSYQNAMQDFLTPTGDMWLDAGKLFLCTLLEGYFEELKKGLFQLPENLAFDNFKNFGAAMKAQFDGEGADYFTDTDWGEALQDLVGVPESGSKVGQSCIMNGNCESGLCDYNAESDKICVECDTDGYKCASGRICNLNKCVGCLIDADCESGEICSSDLECIVIVSE